MLPPILFKQICTGFKFNKTKNNDKKAFGQLRTTNLHGNFQFVVQRLVVTTSHQPYMMVVK